MSESVKRTYGGREYTFGPMNLGFIKRNKDLLQTVGMRSGFADLVAQMPIVVESLHKGMKDNAPSDEDLDALDVPDISDALIAALEASGMLLQKLPAIAPGE